jgi:hypothetical protein
MVIKILFQESESASHAELMEFDFAVVHPMVEGALRNAEVVGGLLGVEPFLLNSSIIHLFSVKSYLQILDTEKLEPKLLTTQTAHRFCAISTIKKSHMGV